MQGSSTHTMATKPNNLVTHDWVRTWNRWKMGARAVTMPMASPILSASSPQQNLTPVSISPLWATAGKLTYSMYRPVMQQTSFWERATGRKQRPNRIITFAGKTNHNCIVAPSPLEGDRSRLSGLEPPPWSTIVGDFPGLFRRQNPPLVCTVYVKLWWLLVCAHVA
jgi:hypothetical protein